MRESTPGRLVVAGVFALQFLIPLIALVGSPAPTRLGFQMYSGAGQVQAHSIDRDGNRDEVDIMALVAVARPDIDWISNLPARRLCAADPGAAAVVVTQGHRTVRHACPTT